MEKENITLQDYAQDTLEHAILIFNIAVDTKLNNEQWFLDWLDKLNELSVRG